MLTKDVRSTVVLLLLLLLLLLCGDGAADHPFFRDSDSGNQLILFEGNLYEALQVRETFNEAAMRPLPTYKGVAMNIMAPDTPEEYDFTSTCCNPLELAHVTTVALFVSTGFHVAFELRQRQWFYRDSDRVVPSSLVPSSGGLFRLKCVASYSYILQAVACATVSYNLQSYAHSCLRNNLQLGTSSRMPMKLRVRSTCEAQTHS